MPTKYEQFVAKQSDISRREEKLRLVMSEEKLKEKLLDAIGRGTNTDVSEEGAAGTWYSSLTSMLNKGPPEELDVEGAKEFQEELNKLKRWKELDKWLDQAIGFEA